MIQNKIISYHDCTATQAHFQIYIQLDLEKLKCTDFRITF